MPDRPRQQLGEFAAQSLDHRRHRGPLRLLQELLQTPTHRAFIRRMEQVTQLARPQATPTTRHQLLQLWQASLALVQDRSGLPPSPSAAHAYEAGAEDDAMVPYY